MSDFFILWGLVSFFIFLYKYTSEGLKWLQFF